MSLFPERLKQLRTSRQVMQKDLAELIDVTPRAIRNYESGLHEPSYDNLIKLATFFNVSLDYLLGLSSDEKQN